MKDLICHFYEAFGFHSSGNMESLQDAKQRNVQHLCFIIVLVSMWQMDGDAQLRDCRL